MRPNTILKLKKTRNGDFLLKLHPSFDNIAYIKLLRSLYRILVDKLGVDEDLVLDYIKKGDD